jgi:hypothetical protein
MLNRTKPLIVLALAAIVFGAGVAGGWIAQGWRLSGQHAQELAARDQQALEVA